MASAASTGRSRRVVRTFYVGNCPLKAQCNGKARFLGASPELAIERVHHHLTHSSHHWRTDVEADALVADLDVEWHDDYEAAPPSPAPKRARHAIPATRAPAPSGPPENRLQQVIGDAVEAVRNAERAAMQSEYLATSAATAFREQAAELNNHLLALEECLAEL